MTTCNILFSNSKGELFLHSEDSTTWMPIEHYLSTLDKHLLSILYYWLEGNGSCDCNRRIVCTQDIDDAVCTSGEYKILEINFGGKDIKFIDDDFYSTLDLNKEK